MRTFHGVRQFNNIVHNAEPVDLHEPWAFLFQYTFLFDAYPTIYFIQFLPISWTVLIRSYNVINFRCVHYKFFSKNLFSLTMFRILKFYKNQHNTKGK